MEAITWYRPLLLIVKRWTSGVTKCEPAPPPPFRRAAHRHTWRSHSSFQKRDARCSRRGLRQGEFSGDRLKHSLPLLESRAPLRVQPKLDYACVYGEADPECDAEELAGAQMCPPHAHAEGMVLFARRAHAAGWKPQTQASRPGRRLAVTLARLQTTSSGSVNQVPDCDCLLFGALLFLRGQEP